jgi:hypothetical protein
MYVYVYVCIKKVFLNLPLSRSRLLSGSRSWSRSFYVNVQNSVTMSVGYVYDDKIVVMAELAQVIKCEDCLYVCVCVCVCVSMYVRDRDRDCDRVYIVCIMMCTPEGSS